MSTLTRADFTEALKVPVIMGRGPACGVVIGINKFHELFSWARANDTELAKGLDAGDVLGLRALITTSYPDTFFAVTAAEYAYMESQLAALDASGSAGTVQQPPLRMTEEELDRRLRAGVDMQPQFASGSRFCLVGWDAAKLVPTVKAMVIALGLVLVVPSSAKCGADGTGADGTN